MILLHIIFGLLVKAKSETVLNAEGGDDIRHLPSTLDDSFSAALEECEGADDSSIMLLQTKALKVRAAAARRAPHQVGEEDAANTGNTASGRSLEQSLPDAKAIGNSDHGMALAREVHGVVHGSTRPVTRFAVVAGLLVGLVMMLVVIRRTVTAGACGRRKGCTMVESGLCIGERKPGALLEVFAGGAVDPTLPASTTMQFEDKLKHTTPPWDESCGRPKLDPAQQLLEFLRGAALELQVPGVEAPSAQPPRKYERKVQTAAK
jgi:hypothetical protein